MQLQSIVLSLILSYFGAFPTQSNDAIKFLNKNKEIINDNLSDLSPEDRLIAISIVAPEISQYSSVTDFLELRTLYVLYLNSGKSDFSVGYFQMKPSFVETLESIAAANSTLRKKFGAIIPTGSERDKRKFRLEMLGSLKGQLQYLDLFMAVVKKKTSKMKFADTKSRLRYWATLYNSGLNISSARNLHFQERKLFPRDKKEFNYSEVSFEFYQQLVQKW